MTKMEHRDGVTKKLATWGSEIEVHGEELSYFLLKLGKKMLPTMSRVTAQTNQQVPELALLCS